MCFNPISLFLLLLFPHKDKHIPVQFVWFLNSYPMSHSQKNEPIVLWQVYSQGMPRHSSISDETDYNCLSWERNYILFKRNQNLLLLVV